MTDLNKVIDKDFIVYECVTCVQRPGVKALVI